MVTLLPLPQKVRPTGFCSLSLCFHCDFATLASIPKPHVVFLNFIKKWPLVTCGLQVPYPEDVNIFSSSLYLSAPGCDLSYFNLYLRRNVAEVTK
jgi:hypothetical protein